MLFQEQRGWRFFNSPRPISDSAGNPCGNLTTHGQATSLGARSFADLPEDRVMAWKTPKIVEIALGAEINSYACADLK